MSRHDDRPTDADISRSPWLVGAVKGFLSGMGMFGASRLLRRSGVLEAAAHTHDLVPAAAVAGICTVMGAGQESERQHAERAEFRLVEHLVLERLNAKPIPPARHADRITQERAAAKGEALQP